MRFKADNTHYKSQAQTQQLTVYWINFKIQKVMFVHSLNNFQVVLVTKNGCILHRKGTEGGIL